MLSLPEEKAWHIFLFVKKSSVMFLNFLHKSLLSFFLCILLFCCYSCKWVFTFILFSFFEFVICVYKRYCFLYIYITCYYFMNLLLFSGFVVIVESLGFSSYRVLMSTNSKFYLHLPNCPLLSLTFSSFV